MTRADELTQLLQLEPHPEGGAYRRVHRSEQVVTAFDPPQRRAALTSIVFLLRAGEFSGLHRITSDEAWHFLEGAPLELLVVAPDFLSFEVRRLGLVSAEQRPVSVVAAHYWQAARSTGDYSLAACSVAPGFEFQSFELLRDDPGQAEHFRRVQPNLTNWI